MFELMVEDTFSAAHALRGYDGPCENLHGHTWKVQVFLKGDKLNKIGILVDFKDVKENLGKVIGKYDHQNLNDLAEFKSTPACRQARYGGQNPSCEILAKLIFDKLKKELKELSKVTVWESEKTSASYFN